MKTSKVWLNADPECGMGIEQPVRGLGSMYRRSPFYRRVDVPIALQRRYAKALSAFNSVQGELGKLFDAKKRRAPQVSEKP